MLYYFVVAFLGLSFLLLFAGTVLIVFYRPAKRPAAGHDPVSFPAVTILKPISNIDDEMEKNLETFYAQDYPNYDIVFGMDTQQRECHELVERVSRKFPQTKTTIVSTMAEKRLNPKVATLSRMEPSCTGSLLWMTDSNVRVEPFTLRMLVRDYAANDSKIVFSPIQGTGSRTMGSIMENAYLNFFVSGNILLAWSSARQPIIVGKSMLIERYTLEKFGGFSHFQEYLAEDFIMGRTYRETGLTVSTNFTWVTNFISTATFSRFWSRVVRWSKIRYNTERFYYFFESLLNPIMVSACALPFLGAKGVPLVAAAVIGKIALEYAAFFAVNSQDRKKAWIIAVYPLSVLIKDFLLFLIFFTPLINKDVFWRGKNIRLDNKGKITHISPAERFS